MCGIFGIYLGPDAGLGTGQVKSILSALFTLSESRGKEAAGLAIRRGGRIFAHKQAVSAGRMLRSGEYRDFLTEALAECSRDSGLVAIGHSRLVTNGTQLKAINNQPCVSGSAALIHNGIIVNDSALWARYPELVRQGEVDTEVLLGLIEMFRKESGNAAQAAAKAFSQVEGSASIAHISGDEDTLLLASNTGSLYFGHSEGFGVFASEKFILTSLLQSKDLKGRIPESSIRQIKPGTGTVIDLARTTGEDFELGPYPRTGLERSQKAFQATEFQPGASQSAALQTTASQGSAFPAIKETRSRNPDLRRCVKCILPETMPFISFDATGVCSYCRAYRPAEYRGRPALEEILAAHRSRNGEPDCIVAFSGGRDSSYGLHYLKRELGMNPIAFSYDWGMVTDLGRRNQARMCGRLGVEHILVSADIRKKRDNIRRNVLAWLGKPHLGMIPLFMAGDKQFFHHANRIREMTGIKLVIFCESPLEKTNFKTGFLGVREGGQRLYDMARLQKLKLNLSYVREFIRNPAYLNRSLLDSAMAFGSAYLIPHDYLFLFRYLPWKEEEINRTLLDTYDWETSPDSPSTWRIGDGSAAFYNYIYSTVAGFTEFDTLRSNQIREGALSRSDALRLVEEENVPRLPSMREYAGLIGFDLDAAMKTIQGMPKLYAKDGASR